MVSLQSTYWLLQSTEFELHCSMATLLEIQLVFSVIASPLLSHSSVVWD